MGEILDLKEILKKSKIFPYLSVFDLSYIPEQIFWREEYEELLNVLVDFYSSKVRKLVFFISSVKGQGKTLILKYFSKHQEKFFPNLTVKYFSLKGCKNRYEVYSRLFNKSPNYFYSQDKVPHSLLTLFNNKIIFFDNCEEVYHELIKLINDFIRAYESARCCFVLSFNSSFDSLADFDSSFFDTVEEKKIIFIKPYTVPDIVKILSLRTAKLGNKIDEFILVQIASHIYKSFDSDMRVALISTKEFLKLKEKEPNTANEVLVKKATQIAYTNLFSDIFSNLSIHKKLILFSIPVGYPIESTILYKNYLEKIKQYQIEPISYAHFLRQLHELVNTISKIQIVKSKPLVIKSDFNFTRDILLENASNLSKR